MATLADANTSWTGSAGTTIFQAPTATNAARATAVHPDTRPAPQGGLLLLAPSGGARG
jgi:hypothetical protein